MMSRDEVVKKWDKKHHTNLHMILSLVDNDDDVILISKDHYHRLVTPQIFKDLGFHLAGTVRHKGEIAFYKYTRDNNHK